MARILWLGDAGSHTGFGTVTHNIGERLVARYGHDVHVLAVNYNGDHVDTNLKLYLPTKNHALDAYGQSRIIELLDKIEPDVVFILNDPFVVRKFLHRNHWDQEKVLLRYRPWADGKLITPEQIGQVPPAILAYMPVDGANIPPMWRDLSYLTWPVLMSEWGKTWIEDAPVVYHGVDTERFRPAEEMPYISSGGMEVRDKRDAKKALGYDPDGFLVVRVDRNSPRKDFADTWRALVPVMRRHEDIQVHFHCKPTGEDGIELPQLFSREPEVADRFFTPGGYDTKKGWAIDDLAILYNAADLFVSTSWAEGFGLTLAESLACGTPVIAQNCSSITEVVGPGGLLMHPGRPIAAPMGQDQWLPDVDAFSEAIEHLYNADDFRRSLGKAGKDHVREKFSWDEAAERFDTLITHVQQVNDGS